VRSLSKNVRPAQPEGDKTVRRAMYQILVSLRSRRGLAGVSRSRRGLAAVSLMSRGLAAVSPRSRRGLAADSRWSRVGLAHMFRGRVVHAGFLAEIAPREATGGHGRPRETTGGHGRPREAAGGHRIPREATGYRGRPRDATGGHRIPPRPVSAHRFWLPQRILLPANTARTPKATLVWGIRRISLDYSLCLHAQSKPTFLQTNT
jgi:hypothetical protein